MFSERGISTVPIVDENGVVVSVETLGRLGAYPSLNLTIAEALNQRFPDFPGVIICAASDSIGTLLRLIKKQRVHRMVVVEGEVCKFDSYFSPYPSMDQCLQEEEQKGGKRVGYWESSHFLTCCATLLVQRTSKNLLSRK